MHSSKVILLPKSNSNIGKKPEGIYFYANSLLLASNLTD